MNDNIGKLVEQLSVNINETDPGDPYFSSDSYKVFPFSAERFHSFTDCKPTRRIAFIDGGNQELIGAPNFSIQLNRIYFNIFDGKNRILQQEIPHRIEFYSATFSKLKNGAIYYDTLVFPIYKEWEKFLPFESDLSFDSTDRTVMVGTMRADIQRVASIARRFAEWSFSFHVSHNALKEGDIVVADGTLQTAFKYESKYYNKALESALNHGVIFTGLAKSSALFTTTGLSLIGALQKLAGESNLQDSKWCYYPVADGFTSEHGARIFVTKLHGNSTHLFRFEINKEQALKMDDSETLDIVGNLAANSNDISFPGYPYGLIEADLSARVTNEEVATQRVAVLSEISKRGLWDKFSRYMEASDAHDVLNFLKSGRYFL